MSDVPYSNRELDLKLGEIAHRLRNLAAAFPPFEKDMRESLSRVEMDINNIRTHIEDRIREERAITNTERAPMAAWKVMMGIGGAIVTILMIFMTLMAPKLLAAIELLVGK